jgi:hypothetical protein
LSDNLREISLVDRPLDVGAAFNPLGFVLLILLGLLLFGGLWALGTLGLLVGDKS